MSSDDEFEDLQNTHFEDELDMLEFSYEKIEFAVYIWSLWVKAFLDEFDEEVSRKLLTEFVETIHSDIFSKIVPVIDDQGTEKILHGFIRRFQVPNKVHEKENPK